MKNPEKQPKYQVDKRYFKQLKFSSLWVMISHYHVYTPMRAFWFETWRSNKHKHKTLALFRSFPAWISFLVSFTAAVPLLAESVLAFAIVAVAVFPLHSPVAVFLTCFVGQHQFWRSSSANKQKYLHAHAMVFIDASQYLEQFFSIEWLCTMDLWQNFPHTYDKTLLYSLTIASSFVSMTLTVDMALFTLTIVALAVGALKIAQGNRRSLWNTRNALV